jgi:hypothetical protein
VKAGDLAYGLDNRGAGRRRGRDVQVSNKIALRLVEAARVALPTPEAAVARQVLAADLALLEGWTRRSPRPKRGSPSCYPVLNTRS